MVRHLSHIRCGVLLLLLLCSACTEQSSVDFETTIPRQQILVKDGWQNRHPVWRADGARILYAAWSSAKDSTLVREVDVATKRMRTLFGVKGVLTFPTYSADSTEFYCITNRLGDHDVWKYKPSISTWSRLSSESGDETFVRPSPDGHTIAYITAYRIALLDLAANRVAYLPIADQLVFSLSWDVDGKSLLFSGMEAFDEMLYRFVLDSSRVKPIVSSGLMGAWPVAADWNKGESPGPYFVFEEGGGLALYAPRDERQTTIVSSGKMPAWSPDGTSLAYINGNNLMLDKIWVVIDE